MHPEGLSERERFGLLLAATSFFRFPPLGCVDPRTSDAEYMTPHWPHLKLREVFAPVGVSSSLRRVSGFFKEFASLYVFPVLESALAHRYSGLLKLVCSFRRWGMWG